MSELYNVHSTKGNGVVDAEELAELEAEGALIEQPKPTAKAWTIQDVFGPEATKEDLEQ